MKKTTRVEMLNRISNANTAKMQAILFDAIRSNELSNETIIELIEVLNFKSIGEIKNNIKKKIITQINSL